jgi:hypothetical protein
MEILMYSKIKKIIIVALFILPFTQSFSQLSKQKFGVGASVGLVEKFQFHIPLSKNIQFSFEVGDIAYGNYNQWGTIGANLKYFFNDDDFSPYLGISFSGIDIGSPIYYIHIPLGVQKFVTDDLAIFVGFNPGTYIDSGTDFSFGVELGASVYL